MIEAICALLGGIVIAQYVVSIKAAETHHKALESVIVAFNEERQQLLDRVQAPTFAEYKQQEVKIIKAKNNEPEPQQVHLL